MTYPKTYSPCDDCPYSFSKNNQESNMCKICEFKQLLDKPTADVVEVKHGEWIEQFKDGFWYYDCPFCDDGYVVMERDENRPNYCHNCGAKMDVSQKEITTERGVMDEFIGFIFIPVKNGKLLRDSQGKPRAYESASMAVTMLELEKLEWDEIGIYKVDDVLNKEDFERVVNKWRR